MDLAAKVIEEIKSGRIDPSNAVSIVQYVAKAVRGDREAALEVVEILSKGPDGVAGTADDLFPETTLVQLEVLLKSQLVGDLTSALASTSKKCGCF
jgi:hypothetical protein